MFCAMTHFAWAMPIRPLTGLEPLVSETQFPPPPNTEAVYTFLDQQGNIMPIPTATTRYLPDYCFVQYTEEMPPPAPPGYQYVWSELQKDICSPAYHFYHEVGSPRYGIDTPDLNGFAQFGLSMQERSGMVSKIMELPEGYYSTEAMRLISNFIITPLRLVTVVGVNREPSVLLEYNVSTMRMCLGTREEISIADLDTITDRVRDKFAGCDINHNVTKVAANIVFHLRSQFLNLPKAEKYSNSGWFKVNSVWSYVHDGISSANDSIIFDTGYQIATNKSLSPREAMQSAMGMLAVGNDANVIVPLVLYAHLGVLFALFEEAGFPPRMLMFVNGKTGSLKTAVCSVLFNLTGDNKRNIPATFRDTVASVEAKFADYADKVLLLDDYSPATTAKNRADMNKLLEDVIRYFGDGKGRGRSNVSVTKAVSTVPRGLCCITGEDTGGSQSSLLRCILIDVANGSFNGRLLAPYQSAPTLWTTHFYHFVQYVGGCFDARKAEIQEEFPLLRSKFCGVLSAGRTVDSAVHLYLTARIILAYGVHVGWLPANDVPATLDVWQNAIITALKRSETASTDLDPVRFYITTLFEAVASGAESIAASKEDFTENPGVLGYDCNGKWHVWPDRIYDLAKKRCTVLGRTFPLSQKKIHAALADAHVIEISQDKRGSGIQNNYLYREGFGERPRMLVIDREIAQRYVEED